MFKILNVRPADNPLLTSIYITITCETCFSLASSVLDVVRVLGCRPFLYLCFFIFPFLSPRFNMGDNPRFLYIVKSGPEGYSMIAVEYLTTVTGSSTERGD